MLWKGEVWVSLWYRWEKQLNAFPKLIYLCCYQNQDWDIDYLTSSSVLFPQFHLKNKHPTKSYSKTGILGNNWTPFLGSHFNCRVFLFQDNVLFCYIVLPQICMHFICMEPHLALYIPLSQFIPQYLHWDYYLPTDKETEAQRRQINEFKIPEFVSGNLVLFLLYPRDPETLAVRIRHRSSPKDTSEFMDFACLRQIFRLGYHASSFSRRTNTCPTGYPHRNMWACFCGLCCPTFLCLGLGHSYSILTNLFKPTCSNW